MRFSRLVIEADQNTVSLALHPRLTVIAGVPAPVRSVLASELIGGLSSARSGVHLELVEDQGRRLKVFRPTTGAHRVIEADTGTDVTDRFRSAEGRIDLLAHFGVDSRRASDLMFVGREELAAEAGDTGRDELVARLAELDQAELWSSAARVRITRNELDQATQALDDGDDDTEVVAQVEARHQALEEMAARQRDIQRNLMRVAVLAFGCAIPIGLIGSGMVLPMLGVGFLTALWAWIVKNKIDAAHRSEEAALAAAGTDSYLGFVVKRVDGMMSGTEQRRRVAAIAEDHRVAAIAWTRLVGAVDVEWAFAHHDEIQSAARLRHQLLSLGQVSATAPEFDDEVASLAQSLMAHLGRLRRIGTDHESFPLVLDDPFLDVEPSTRLSLLELLARSAGSPQVVLLTDQDDVASWARLESLTEEVALVEPLADHGRAEATELAG